MWWVLFHPWILAGVLWAAAMNAPAEVSEPFQNKQPAAAGPEEGISLSSSSEKIAAPAVTKSTLPLPPSSKETLAPISQSSSSDISVASNLPPASSSVPPPAAAAMVGSAEYKIQQEDVLEITVYEEPDLSTKVRVTGSGEIHFPLLGRIQVAGLSVIEVQEKVTELLARDYLVNPQVQVFIETYHTRNVFVTGAVNRPGPYALPTGKVTTLMEAVTMAGGFTEEAAGNSTRIVRIENGNETSLHVKANDIVKKGDKAKDVEVLPNDVIFVPESFF